MPRLTTPPAWRDVVTIHRLEYVLPLTYLCYAALGACFAVTDTGQLAHGTVILAVLANLLLIVGPLALNVAVDMRTDERHREKGYLADAATGFGRRRALRWAIAEMTTGLALSIAVSLLSGSWLAAVAGMLLVALQVAYNVEPVRLKRRGFAGPAAFGIASVGLPFLISHGAVSATIEGPVWLVVAGMGLLSVGRTVWWSLPDQAADTASGIAAPAVRYGLRRTIGVCCLVLACGLALVVAGLWWRYGPLWALLPTAAHAVFLHSVVTLAGRRSDELVPSARRMLKRTLPLVAIGELAMVATALSNT